MHPLPRQLRKHHRSRRQLRARQEVHHQDPCLPPCRRKPHLARHRLVHPQKFHPQTRPIRRRPISIRAPLRVYFQRPVRQKRPRIHHRIDRPVVCQRKDAVLLPEEALDALGPAVHEEGFLAKIDHFRRREVRGDAHHRVPFGLEEVHVPQRAIRAQRKPNVVPDGAVVLGVFRRDKLRERPDVKVIGHPRDFPRVDLPAAKVGAAQHRADLPVAIGTEPRRQTLHELGCRQHLGREALGRVLHGHRELHRFFRLVRMSLDATEEIRCVEVHALEALGARSRQLAVVYTRVEMEPASLGGPQASLCFGGVGTRRNGANGVLEAFQGEEADAALAPVPVAARVLDEADAGAEHDAAVACAVQ
mmetsp:Transcript_13945/g.37252  ORF Transcript_13945/g.37252 Transcript_13945/m.37252 type:complete len:361 (-) Transcript_13945:154-1236(-)